MVLEPKTLQISPALDLAWKRRTAAASFVTRVCGMARLHFAAVMSCNGL
jgi:hypothetical protein